MSISKLSAAGPRPEYERTLEPLGELGIEQALPLHERLWRQAWLRKAAILILLAVIWETVARIQNNDLLLPGVIQTARAFFEDLGSGELTQRVERSLWVLVQAYLAGVALAFVFTSLAISSQFGRDLLATLTSMFNPLPAIALLPLALLWFGLGQGSLIFVIIHSVLWALALNTYSGFLSVSPTLRRPRCLRYWPA